MLIRWQSDDEALAKIAGMHTGETIRIEQTRSIYRNSAPGLITTCITVTVLSGALVFIEAAALAKALVVIGVMTLQTGARLVLYRAFAMMDRIASNTAVPRLIICDYRLRENETGCATSTTTKFPAC